MQEKRVAPSFQIGGRERFSKTALQNGASLAYSALRGISLFFGSIPSYD